MKENISQGGDEKSELNIRPAEEVIPKVKEVDEQLRSKLKIPTKAEVENSDKSTPFLMCDPFIEADDFLSRTKHAKAIIVVAFASGAMPDRLVPAIKQRIEQGIPVFVLSNNPRDDSGILSVKYEAGSGAYYAGAIGLQKVNVKNHLEVKDTIRRALKKGLTGQELAKEIEQSYAYKEGEELPVNEWDDPNYVEPPKKDMKDILKDSGFTDNDGNYIPSK